MVLFAIFNVVLCLFSQTGANSDRLTDIQQSHSVPRPSMEACNSPAQHGVQLLSLHQTNVEALFAVYIGLFVYTVILYIRQDGSCDMQQANIASTMSQHSLAM